MKRYLVEPDYRIQEGCKCGSCWEYTGKWLGIDMNDIHQDVVFDTEYEANEWLAKKLLDGDNERG